MALATLQSTMPPAMVKFDLNPDQILMSRTASLTSRASASSNTGTPAGASASIFKKAPAPMITLSKVTFFGPDTKGRCDQLFDWMSPGGGLLGALAGAVVSAATGGAVNLMSKPPMVIFQWGPPGEAFFYEGIINTVNVNYSRFAPDGSPIRAEVTIRMQEQPSLLSLLATNPTSAGLPGRKAHTVSSGDSLARIATDRYGSPGRWRQIADCNGIDDPLRVRPGDRVYLPNPDELGGGGR
jgi:nucleoid-associated protein YgaU